MNKRGLPMQFFAQYRQEVVHRNLTRGLMENHELIVRKKQLDARRAEVDLINNIMNIIQGKKDGKQ